MDDVLGAPPARTDRLRPRRGPEEPFLAKCAGGGLPCEMKPPGCCRMASAKAMMPWQCRATVRSWLLYLLRRSVCQRRRVRVVPSQGRRPKHSAVLAQNASGAASDVYSQLRLPRSGARPLPCRRSAGSTRAVDEGWFAGTPMGLPAAQAPAASCGVVVTQLRLSRSGARPLPCRRSAGSATRARLPAPQWGSRPELSPHPAVRWSSGSGSRAAEPGRGRAQGRLVRRRGLVGRHRNGPACPSSRRVLPSGGHEVTQVPHLVSVEPGPSLRVGGRLGRRQGLVCRHPDGMA